MFPIEPVVKVQRGSRGVAMFSLNFVARWVGGSRPRPYRFPLGEDPTIFIVEEAGWAPWPGWRGVKKRNSLVSTWVRTLNRSDCSESLYRVRYPGSNFLKIAPILVWVFLHAVVPSVSGPRFCMKNFFLPCIPYHLLYSTWSNLSVRFILWNAVQGWGMKFKYKNTYLGFLTAWFCWAV